MSNTEHDGVRERYFGNEAFVIGMLEVVAGGSIVAVLAQIDVLARLAPRWLLLVCLTLLVAALGAAVLAATWRYFYTLWYMKERAALKKGEVARSERHGRDSSESLQDMRRAIPLSVFFLISSYVLLLCGMWFRFLA
jgi:hypothetical protein